MFKSAAIKSLMEFCVFFFLFLFHHVESIFVYYQNYEYLSTVKLNDYLGYYGNVKVLRYSIPNDVLSAIWRLQLVATDNCPPTFVYFYLDYAAYPVFSPHNRTFPKNFHTGRLTKTSLKVLMAQKQSNVANPFRQDVYLNVSSPHAGYWYSAAFIDSNDQKVKPDLLKSNCSFYLTASVNLWQINDTVILYPNKTTHSTSHLIFKTYKYISPSYNGPLRFSIKIASSNADNSMEKCSLTALQRQSTFPDMNSFENNENFAICDSNQTDCLLSVTYPLKNTWYYLAITSNCNYSISVLSNEECASSREATNALASNLDTSNNNSLLMRLLTSQQCNGKATAPIETFRFIGPTYFSVKYYFNSNYNRSNALLLKEDRKPYFIEFLVDLANSGGTLNFMLANNLIYDQNYEQHQQLFSKVDLNNNNNNNISNSSFPGSKMPNYNKNLADVRIMVNICLLYNSMNYKKCPDGYSLSSQSYANVYSNLKLSVAYPMIGMWYLAVWKECFDIGSNQSVPCPTSYIPYSVIQIASDQCSNDYCGDYGTCYIINSQLNLFSACKCSGGYEGYGCTDATNAISTHIYLASVLFLTLSNMIFLFPICLALYRRWYIEALIYFYNMFFSTFYHACDQEFYSFCIFNYDGLQLADFISSYASFVITILSMSAFTRQWKVFTFFVGLLACLSINLYDRFSNVAFVVFLCISLSVTIFTWVKVCVSNGKLHPNRRTLLFYYLPGFSLAITGLLIYSFLQTKSNYWILHSVWHVCMASSIIFFLPKREHVELIHQQSKQDAGESLKDITTTSSSMSDSSGTSSSRSSSSSAKEDTNREESAQTALHANPTEITLLSE